MRHTLFIGWMAMLLLFSACSELDEPTSIPSATRTALADESDVQDAIATIIAQTPSPTPTRTPRATAQATRAITPQLQPVPSLAPACPSTQRTRLIVGERGRVMDDDPRPLNVREGPSTDFRILGRLETLQIFWVLDGPRCAGGFVWFYAERGNLRGWVAEGDANAYYVEPYPPG